MPIRILYQGREVTSLRCLDNYNAILSVNDLSEDSGPVLEPVTLQEVKDYMRLEGFNSDDSPGTEMDFDDGLVTELITEARMWVEKYSGIHCVPKRLQVIASNGNGMIELPGPVVGTIDMLNGETAVTDYKIVGSHFPLVRSPLSNNLTMTYAAGYDYGTAPAWVKGAIKAYCAWAYEHRGDEVNLKGSPERAAAICRPHRRVQTFA